MTPNYAAQDSKMDRASRMLRILHMRRQEKNLLEEKIEEKESLTDEKNLVEETKDARKQKNKNRTA